MRAVIAVAATLASVAAFAQAPADGDTAKLVAARCTQCHELARVTGAGYSATDWHNVLDMMRNVGATFSDAEAATLVAYLAEHYPERARPAAVMVQGPARVEIAEWTVPSPGARPHDPLMSRDGALGTRASSTTRWGGSTPHRRIPRIRAQDSEVGTSRPHRGQPRAHLVHREWRRTSAPSIRRPAAEGIPDARGGCARSAYADIRREGTA
jgi:hypothetical protein